MGKLMVVGDLHLWDKSVSSRKDDYSKTALDKLKQVLDYACDSSDNGGISDLLFLGDIFHSRRVHSVSFMSRVIELFRNAKLHVRIKILPGNHDISYTNWQTYKNNGLGLLESTGFISVLDTNSTVQLGGRDSPAVLGGLVPYSDLSEYSQEYRESVDVLAVHGFIEDPFFKDDKLNYIVPGIKVIFPNVKTIFAGHDHRFFKPEIISDVLVLRPGSLLRTQNTKSNWDRKLGFYVCSGESMRDYEWHAIEYKESAYIFDIEGRAIESAVESQVNEFMAGIDVLKSNVGDGMAEFIASVLAGIDDVAIKEELDRRLHEAGIL
jgi:DNA repair exonuclease SbcCD nuclease subunit